MALNGGFAHDPRHRYSYELRPSPALDASIRELATTLESDGLLLAGASTAPRFQPHLTFLRAAEPRPELVDSLAAALAHSPEVTLARPDVFGGGRIVFLQPEPADALQPLREQLIAAIEHDQLDPVIHTRRWLPHVTVAYAIPEAQQPAALAAVAAAAPLAGSWASVECWDLDVRPTRLIHAARIASAAAG